MFVTGGRSFVVLQLTGASGSIGFPHVPAEEEVPRVKQEALTAPGAEVSISQAWSVLSDLR